MKCYQLWDVGVEGDEAWKLCDAAATFFDNGANPQMSISVLLGNRTDSETRGYSAANDIKFLATTQCVKDVNKVLC